MKDSRDNILFKKSLYHYKNLRILYPQNQYFLIRLIKYGKILSEDYHREMGNQCGYKKCCIDNFIKVIYEVDIKAGQYMDNKYGPDSNKIYYVRCKKCRKLKKEVKQNEN